MKRCLICLPILFFLCGPALAVTRTVTTFVDELDTPSGGSLSLREAIRDSVNGDVIEFNFIFADATLTLTQSNLVIDSKSITIDASTLSRPVRLEMTTNRNDRIVDVRGPATVEFIGLELGDTSVSGDGGLIHNSNGADLTIRDCLLEHAAANGRGGAVLNDNATLRIIDTEIRDCSAGDAGGAIYSQGAASYVAVTRSHIHHNHATEQGGGILCEGGAFLDLVDAQVMDNRSEDGAGVCVSGTHLRSGASTIARNCSARFGGGICLDASTPMTLRNSTVADNEAFLGGGVYAVSGATPTVNVSTISGNRARLQGGGLFCDRADLTVRNSIIAANHARRGNDIWRNEGTVTDEETNIIGDNTSVRDEFPVGSPSVNGDFVGVAEIPLDPRLGPLGEYGGPTPSMILLAGSPAIDGATGTIGVSVDQGNRTRPTGAASDIGAFEVTDAVVVTTAQDEDDGVLGLGTGISLREAILYKPVTTERITISTNLSGASVVLGSALDVSGVHCFVDATMLSDPLVLDGGGTTAHFGVDAAGRLSLHGVRLQDGFQPQFSGGSIGVTSGSLILDRCHFQANVAEWRGGAVICLNESQFVASECSFTSNRVVDAVGVHTGGALSLRSNGQSVIRYCQFDTNSVQQGSLAGGGAMSVTNSNRLDMVGTGFTGNLVAGDAAQGGSMWLGAGTRATIRDCFFHDGLAAGSTGSGLGGGIYNFDGNLTILSSSFASNQVTSSLGGATTVGGALLDHSHSVLEPSRLHIENCTFTQNSAIAGGGAISFSSSSSNPLVDATLRHVTVSHNFAEAGGGGIRIGGDGGVVRLDNSLVSQNVVILPVDGADIQTPGVTELLVMGTNLIGNNTTVESYFPLGPLVGNFASPVDPLLSAYGSYGEGTPVCLLQQGSPARDAAAVRDDVWQEQRPYPRLRGALPDIGASEADNDGGYTGWALENIPAGLDDAFDENAEGDPFLNGVEYGVKTVATVTNDAPTTYQVTSNGVVIVQFPYRPRATDLLYSVQFAETADMVYSNRASLNLETMVNSVVRGLPRGTELLEDPFNERLTYIEATTVSNGVWRVSVDQP